MYQNAFDAIKAAYNRLPKQYGIAWHIKRGFFIYSPLEGLTEGEPELLILSRDLPPIPLSDTGKEILNNWLEAL